MKKLNFALRRMAAKGLIVAALCFPGLSNAQEFVKIDPKVSVAKFMACLDAKNITLISAHRGGAVEGYPENALETLKNTVAYGPMLLEVDVRETADGHLVLLHDSTLERTSSGSGELTDYTLAQLSDIRLVDNDGTETPFTIPTLKSVLKWAKDRAILQLDVKRGIDYGKVAKVVAEADAIDSVLLITYQIDDALEALKVDERFNFAMTIRRKQDLDRLDASDVKRNQVVAWTGVVKDAELPFWQTLEMLGIPAIAGALWDLEENIVSSGNPQPYHDIAGAGVDIIAADYYQLAFDTLNTQQDLSAAITYCEHE